MRSPRGRFGHDTLRRIGGSKHPGLLTIAIGLALLVTFWLARILLTGAIWSFDHTELTWPTLHWTWSQIRSGTFPLWNPYLLAGRPTLATLQGGLLHPFHVIYAFTPIATGMAISVLAHLALAGAGALWLARRIGLAWPACLLAGVLLCLRGAHPGGAENLAILESLAWLAPGLAATHALIEGQRLRGALGVSACCAFSLLAGFPQTTLYAVYTWGFFALFVPLANRRPLAEVATGVSVFALAIALAAAIAAAQLLPALELAGQGVRTRGALPLHRMFPFGLAGYETMAGGLARSLQSRVVMPELFATFGVVGLCLVPLSVLARAGRPGREGRAIAVAFLIVAVLTLGVAAGPASPIFDLYLRLPELSSFREPGRVLAVTDLCFAMLAAIGLDRSMSWLERGAGTRAAMTAGAVVVLAALLEIFLAPTLPTPAARVERAALWQTTLEPSSFFAPLEGDPDRAWVWERPGPERMHWKGLGARGIRALSDYDAMFSRKESEFVSFLVWGGLERTGESEGGTFVRPFYGRVRVVSSEIDPQAVLARRRLAEVASVRHLIVERALTSRAPYHAALSDPSLRRVAQTHPRYARFEDTRAVARAFVTHRVSSAPEPHALLSAMADPAFDPREASWVEGSTLPSVEPASEGAAGTSARERVEITRDDLHRVDLDVELLTPGLVVLTDAWDPGWRADIDGEPAPIWITNHLFRGVRVQAGRHQVRFAYRPASFQVGSAITLAGIAVWLGLALHETRRSKNRSAG